MSKQETFGAELKRRRTALALTQTEMAIAFNGKGFPFLSQSQIAAYERERNQPRVELADMIRAWFDAEEKAARARKFLRIRGELDEIKEEAKR